MQTSRLLRLLPFPLLAAVIGATAMASDSCLRWWEEWEEIPVDPQAGDIHHAVWDGSRFVLYDRLNQPLFESPDGMNPAYP